MMIEMTNKQIIFISQVFHPDTSSTSILFSPLIASIAQRGVDISVLSGCSEHTTGEFSREDVWRGVPIKRCGVRLNTKQNMLVRMIAYFAFIFHVFFALLMVPRQAQVIAVTNPPFLAWALYLASKVRRFEYSYFFLDLHPEGLVALKTIKGDALTTKLWFTLNRISYRGARRLAVLGRDMLSKLEPYGLEPDKITYIPHWSAFDLQAPVKFNDSKFVKTRNLQDKFVIQYSGNMGLWHDIETLVKVAGLLVDRTDITFEFIGGGIRKQSAQKKAESLGCSNISWRDFVDEADLSDSLAACHVALISLNEGLEGIAVPCKLYGILASGRAVLAQVPAESEVAYTVLEHNSGLVVSPGDPKALADAIIALQSDIASTMAMGDRGFAAAKEHYSINVAAEKFLSWVES